MRVSSKCLMIVSTCAFLASCGGSEENSASGDIKWKHRHSGGFKAEVPSSFGPQTMQETFGDYCKRYNKQMRALKMGPIVDGVRVVEGDCF